MNESKWKKYDSELKSLYGSGLSCYKISAILGIPKSSVGYRVKTLGLSRSISESLVGQAKSESHKGNLSESRILSGVAKGSKNPNWQGGKTKEWEKRMAIIKRHPDYKNWVRIVKSVGFCKSCGSVNKLEAHHILKKSTHPHLIHDIKNGMCLCKVCHQKLHSGAKFHSDELLGTLTVNDEGNQQPSLQSRKVQRLLETSDGLNNQLECPTRK